MGKIQRTRLDDGRVVLGAPPPTKRRDRDMTRTVVVACKLPNGLIIHNYTRGEEQVPGMHPSLPPVMVPIFVRSEIAYAIKGYRLRSGSCRIIRSSTDTRSRRTFRETSGRAGSNSTRISDLIKNKIVFAASTLEDAKAFAREHDGLFTGLEPMEPSTTDPYGRPIHRDPRMRTMGKVTVATKD